MKQKKTRVAGITSLDLYNFSPVNKLQVYSLVHRKTLVIYFPFIHVVWILRNSLAEGEKGEQKRNMEGKTSCSGIPRALPSKMHVQQRAARVMNARELIGCCPVHVCENNY
jgi:hypothetical protein